jgi:hypothetical protein
MVVDPPRGGAVERVDPPYDAREIAAGPRRRKARRSYGFGTPRRSRHRQKGLETMNNIRSAIAGVAVLAAGAGTFGVLASTGTASAGTTPSGIDAARAGSFSVRVHHGSETNLDLGTSGFGAGDQNLFTGSLTRAGKHVGRVVGTCTTARAGRSSVDQLCEFVLRLGRSQLVASGTVSAGRQGPGTFALPILGGTGRYRTAAGEIAVTATSGKSFPIRISLA